MTDPTLLPDRRSRPARSLALAAAAAVVLTAACGGGGRPDPLPGDRPVLQLSQTRFSYEMRAFEEGSIPLALGQVKVTNSGAKPDPRGAPTFAFQYLEGDQWLALGLSDSRTLHVGIAGSSRGGMAQALGGGTYRAQVIVEWEGAVNSPAIVDIELVVRPYAEAWELGQPVVQRYRASHTTTALEDGGALVVGGRDLASSPEESSAVLGSIERMDPETGIWTQTAALLRAREEHTATRLPDGRIFIAGGQNAAAPEPPDATWEIYDPVEDRIVDHGSLLHPRYDHAAVLLEDGRVLLVGGWNREDGPLGGTRTCEVFDPADPEEPMKPVGSLHGDASETTAAVRLTDGRVLVLNQTPPPPGATGGDETGAELFDPAAGTWTRVAPRPRRSVLNGLAPLPDGKALVFGGLDAPDVIDPEDPLAGLDYLANSDVFDPATGRWSAAGPLRAPRLMIRDQAVALPDGKVLLAGGAFTILMGLSAMVEVFDPATRTWTLTGSLTTSRGFHTATLLEDGTVLATGGWPDNAESRAELWRAPPQ
jgi:hypothetical protein